MRVLSIAIIVSLLLISGAISSYIYVDNSSKGIVEHLSTVEKSIEQDHWDKAQESLIATQNSWAKTKDWWTILLDHQEIDNIDISLKRLEKYIQTKGTTLSLGEVSTLKLLFDHVKDNETFNVRNIL